MNCRKRVCFLPDDFRHRRTQRRTNKLCAAMFLLIMAAIGFTIGGTEYALLQVGVDHDRVSQQYAQAAQRVEQLAELRDTQNRLAHQATVFADLLQKVPPSYMLAEVTNALPAEVSLIDLNLTPASTAKAADEQPADAAIRVTGVAGSDVQITVFVSQLSRSRVLKDVNLLSTADNPQSPAEPQRFTIGLTPDGHAAPTPASPAISSAAVDLSPE